MLVRMELSKRGNLLGGVCMTCVHLYHYNTQKDRLELKCVIHIKNKQLNLERQRVLSISVKKMHSYGLEQVRALVFLFY